MRIFNRKGLIKLIVGGEMSGKMWLLNLWIVIVQFISIFVTSNIQRGIFGIHAYLQLIGSLALSSVDRSFGSHDFHLYDLNFTILSSSSSFSSVIIPVKGRKRRTIMAVEDDAYTFRDLVKFLEIRERGSLENLSPPNFSRANRSRI